jgi:MerR family transcriptional regulator/heat shock protein HspR
MLGVQQAFLRSLDAAQVVSPERSSGGHRRYSRRQLEMVGRLREEFDKGHTLAAAARILGLEDDLAAANDEIADLQGRLSRADETDGEE